jgi:Holliday junction resolvasome RuvABC ATP-dependent DNA helicase subunit
VPREAIRFAKQVLLSAERQDSTDYQTICEIVAARNGVDQWGLNRQHYSVLVALYNSDFMSIKRLSDQVMISVDALEEYILPPISVSTDSLPLVGVSTRGYYITKEGVNRLTIKGYIQENKSFSVAARNK